MGDKQIPVLLYTKTFANSRVRRFVSNDLIMRYVAAYLLAVLGGNSSPSAADIKKILSSVGVDAEAGALDKVVECLKGKDINELIQEGNQKLASVPSGGGGAAAAAPAAGGAAAAAEAPKEEKKEKKSESENSDDDDMGFGLFD